MGKWISQLSVLALVALMAYPAYSASPPPNQCDYLAAAPDDPDKMVEGVEFSKLVAQPAINYCKKAVSEHPNVLRFQFQYARALRRGKKHSEALIWYNRAVANGYSAAQSGLGLMYIGGYGGVFQDIAKGLELTTKAARQGHGNSQLLLGGLYGGVGDIPKDDVKSAKWYNLAAEGGMLKAQSTLALLYYSGQGVQKNYAQAMKWFRRAADHGDAVSQYYIGLMYVLGQNVPKNFVKAKKWFKLAALQGHDDAQHSIGLIYYQGWDVPKDYAEALKWFKLAANQGNKSSQRFLGILYGSGHGVSTDFVEAHKWFSLAAKQGDRESSKAMGQIAKILTANQLKEAKRLADSWEPEQPKKVLVAKKRPSSAAPAVIESFPLAPVNVRFRSSSPRPDDIAVIIGNANYKKQGKDIPNVTPAYADAEGIKRYFKDALGVKEGNIIHLKDATGSQLVSVFGNSQNYKGKLFNWVKPGQSKVYVYYAGHGAPAGDEGSAYMIPSDSSVDSIELTGYPLATLYKNLGKIGAKSVTVILEACFSGTGQGGTLISNASPVYLKAKTPKIPANLTVISAGAANQMASWEENKSHSLFTKYFLKGMSGKADVEPYGNGDGKVNYTELGKYLDGTMSYFARRYYGRDQTAQIVNGG